MEPLRNSCGLGGVVRDNAGNVTKAICSGYEGGFNVDVVEAFAKRLGLQLAHEAGQCDIIAETDNLKLFHHLQHDVKENSSLGKLVKWLHIFPN